MKTLKINSIKLKNPLILAPMAEITNLPYRMLCRKAGAALCYTEMLYTSAILHENRKTLDLMKTIRQDSPLGIQITGSSLAEFREVCKSRQISRFANFSNKKFENSSGGNELFKFLFKKIIPHVRDYSLVDINCGCPSQKLIAGRAGAYLLNSPEKISRIIKILKNEGLTVTAKIRLGAKKNNALKIAKTIERAGADAITIHPRLAVDSYSTPADWNEIRKIKSKIGIQIIGNGDIFSPEDAERMLEIADGAMFARAAIGDPLIFRRTLHYLKTKKLLKPDFKQNMRCFKEYIQLSKKHGLIDIQRTKHLAACFIKNIPYAARLRQEITGLKSFNEIEEFVNNLIRP